MFTNKTIVCLFLVMVLAASFCVCSPIEETFNEENIDHLNQRDDLTGRIVKRTIYSL